MTADVIAFDPARNTNAKLMVDVHRLGWIGDDDLTLDATYGQGRFWNTWRPKHLLTNDLDPERETNYHHDVRALPFADGAFHCVVFDPPYKLNGTPSGPMDDAYGVGGGYTNREGRHELIGKGVTECQRIAERTLLVKCMDQVNSGQVRWQGQFVVNTVVQYGWRLADSLHVLSGRPQPAGRSQKHSRRNYSTLLVFVRNGKAAR